MMLVLARSSRNGQGAIPLAWRGGRTRISRGWRGTLRRLGDRAKWSCKPGRATSRCLSSASITISGHATQRRSTRTRSGCLTLRIRRLPSGTPAISQRARRGRPRQSDAQSTSTSIRHRTVAALACVSNQLFPCFGECWARTSFSRSSELNEPVAVLRGDTCADLWNSGCTLRTVPKFADLQTPGGSATLLARDWPQHRR